MDSAMGMAERYLARWKYTRGYFRKIRCMGRDSFIGLMGGFMKGNGTLTRRMDLENTFGLMVRCMKGSSVMIIAQVLASFTILMGSDLKVNGKTGKSTVKGITSTLTVPCSRQCIGMERKLLKASSLTIHKSQQQRQK